MKKLSLVALLMVAVLVVAASCVPAAPKMDLPEGAQKLTDVIPGMGEHWADLAQMPLGPIYLVYKGEVVGIEYMWSEDMMQEVSIPTPAGPEEFKVLVPLPVGVTVDHAVVSFMTHGHEGFEMPHSDMHMYFTTQAEVAAITP